MQLIPTGEVQVAGEMHALQPILIVSRVLEEGKLQLLGSKRAGFFNVFKVFSVPESNHRTKAPSSTLRDLTLRTSVVNALSRPSRRV